jgi:DNA-binding MarR family transcriptional regulator
MTHDDPIAQDASLIDEHLRAVRLLLRRPFELAIAQRGLTPPQLQVLRALAPTAGLSLKDLSQRVGLAHSTVSGIVDRLEREQLVRREVDPADRRVSRIVLTEQVRSYLQTILPSPQLSPLLSALQRAGAAERALIIAGLTQLRRLLEASPANGDARDAGDEHAD